MKKRNRASTISQVSEIDPNFWVTPLGDMMTFLMIFFLILWAYTQFIQKREVRKIPSPTNPKIQSMINELKNAGEVIVTKRKVAVQLPEAVLFDSGKADLKPGAKNTLSIVAGALKKSEAPIVVEGHTDNIPVIRGRWKNNWQLSTVRAFSVIRYLIHQEDIPPDRLSARGYGPYRPIAPFDTPENREKNRRVEINIMTSYETP